MAYNSAELTFLRNLAANYPSADISGATSKMGSQGAIYNSLQGSPGLNSDGMIEGEWPGRRNSRYGSERPPAIPLSMNMAPGAPGSYMNQAMKLTGLLDMPQTTPPPGGGPMFGLPPGAQDPYPNYITYGGGANPGTARLPGLNLSQMGFSPTAIAAPPTAIAAPRPAPQLANTKPKTGLNLNTPPMHVAPTTSYNSAELTALRNLQNLGLNLGSIRF